MEVTKGLKPSDNNIPNTIVTDTEAFLGFRPLMTRSRMFPHFRSWS